ncbi:hypothetical protein SNK04_001528 [Fusarium graminearum]
MTFKSDTSHDRRDGLYINDRGYVDFSPEDKENPRNWSKKRRLCITCIAVFLAMNGNFASSIFSGSVDSVVEEFGVSTVAASLTTSMFLLGFCAGPFVFAPLSEFYGRRWIFYITFIAYMAFNFLCAFPPNFRSLLVGRFLAGVFISSPLSTTPGVLVDLWDPIERGNATGIFSLASWVGPSLGPIVSGFVQLKKDWRWGIYSVLWLGGATIFLMFIIPETHAPTILAQKSKRARQSGIKEYEHVVTEGEEDAPGLAHVYKLALTRPWILMFDLISSSAPYTPVLYSLSSSCSLAYTLLFSETCEDGTLAFRSCLYSVRLLEPYSELSSSSLIANEDEAKTQQERFYCLKIDFSWPCSGVLLSLSPCSGLHGQPITKSNG